MPKKPPITDDDIEAFRKAVAGTKPLVQRKIRLASSAPLKVKRPKKAAIESFHFDESHYVEPVQGEEFISFKHPSISHKVLRNLRKGQYNVEAVLDLHGMTVDEAQTAIDRFLHECLSEGVRVILIIHGKGHHSQMPILKNKLNHWLRQLNVVLAFCSAAPAHGSRGALYVLLKHSEENLT